jgi:peptidoglycan/xylan/chitin deacetylase (PgdA/CDA1 family)
MRALVVSSILLAAATSTAEKRAPVPNNGPEILLTFDDGPAIDKTPQVLDILDKHHIKAVFFVNGWHLQGTHAAAEKSRAVLRETLRRGHAIGNHTVHHYFLCGKVYSKRASQEIEENASLIEQAIGQRPDLFRTPYGAHCKALSETLLGLGIKHTGWDIDPQDWKLKNALKIENYVTNALKKLNGRAIVLFHDVHIETVHALPKVLDWIDAENKARAASGRPQIKIIDYAYLIPEHKLVPPALDTLGRVLIEFIVRTQTSPLGLWLAWPPGQV